MDIRKFFAKADGKKKPGASKPSAANASRAVAPAAAAPKRSQEKEDEPVVQDSSEKRSGPSPTKKHRVEQEVEEVSSKTSSPSSKEDWVQVTKEDNKQSPSKPSPSWVEVSKSELSDKGADSDPSPVPVVEKETRKVSSDKKRRLVIEDDDDDDDDDDDVVPRSSSKKKTKTAILQDDDDAFEEDDDQEAESPPEKSPSPKKSSKKSPPSSKRKSKKDEHKDSLLQPTLKLSSFSADSAVPECLSGTTFVFSGVLENMSRDASEDFVKTLGGRVTSAVSGKTDYLVVGDVLEDGRPYSEGSKYRKAKETDVIIVKGEEQLFGLVKLYNDKAKEHAPAEVPQPAPVKPAPAKMPSNPYAKRPVNPYAKSAKPSGASNPYASKSAPSTKKEESVPSKYDNNMSLWADKYSPQTTRDILGNQENVKKLTNWLNRWEDIFNTPKAQGKTFSSPNGPWKAALLSGPPGIGKTTTATLVAKESGRDLLELNASDARSKKALSESLGDVTGSQVLNFKGGGSKTAKKRCIIMDEVDGMGAGDRSGMAELIKMIKSSKVPIICICNDRQNQKIKSLVPYCLDLRFRRPTKSVIARRAIRIGEQEGMKVEANAAEAIAESCGNDIRQVLNSLQMWSNKDGNSITYKELKEREGSINKDEILRVSMFDATKQIVEGRRGLSGADAKAERDSLYKRSDAFFVDYSLMGLNVHQNYPKVLIGQYTEAKRANDEAKTLEFLERMHDATEAMSDYAVAEHAIRSGDQNWGLLPFAAMLAVKTGYHAGGENGGFLSGFPEFAGWMGKNSSRGKKSRLLQELNHHMNYKVSGDSQELRMCYLPVLRERFQSLLSSADGARTEEAIQLMDDYGLDRDDVFENLDEFKMDPQAKGLAASLDSKQKAAFTRAYNEGSHKSQALVAEQGGGKTRRLKASRSSLDPTDPDVVDDDKQEESEEEDDNEVESAKALEMFKKKGAKRAAAKKKGAKKAAAKKK